MQVGIMMVLPYGIRRMTSRADQPRRLVFLDRGTIAPQIVVRRPAFAHTWIEYERTAPEQLSERLVDRPTIVITNKVPLRASVLAGVCPASS